MSDRDLVRVLAVLESRESPPSVTVRRRTLAPPDVPDLPRMPARLQDRCTNAWMTHMIKPRNVHRDGMRFLIGAFVHDDVRCVVLLRDHQGRPAQLTSQVVSCRHVQGRLHEVSITFERPVNLDRYQFPDGTPLENAQSTNA